MAAMFEEDLFSDFEEPSSILINGTPIDRAQTVLNPVAVSIPTEWIMRDRIDMSLISCCPAPVYKSSGERLKFIDDGFTRENSIRLDLERLPHSGYTVMIKLNPGTIKLSVVPVGPSWVSPWDFDLVETGSQARDLMLAAIPRTSFVVQSKLDIPTGFCYLTFHLPSLDMVMAQSRLDREFRLPVTMSTRDFDFTLMRGSMMLNRKNGPGFNVIPVKTILTMEGYNGTV